MIFTDSLEDYLLAIYEIEANGDIPRVKSISDLLGKKHTSAIEALKKLEREEYIDYQKRGYIKITQKGVSKAQSTYKRRMFLENFLSEYLKMKSIKAGEIAMILEHIDSREFFRGMEVLKTFFENNPQIKSQFDEFAENCSESVVLNRKTLESVKKGKKVRILELTGSDFLRKRFIAMGIVPGAEISVEGYAPLGDPIEIKVKGYNLALRKDEASQIVIEEK